jgi:hypothetical protein
MMSSAASRRVSSSRPPGSRTGSSKRRAQVAAGLDRAISYLPCIHPLAAALWIE